MELNWMLDEYDGIVYVIDLESYDLMYMNQSGCKTVGLTRDEILGRKCYEVLQGFDSPCGFCTRRKLDASGFYEWEYYNRHLGKTFLLKDRRFIWNGKPARIEFVTDVSDYRKKIKNSENQRESVLKSLPGGISRIDARDGKTVLWHGANFLPMIGYTKEQFENELHNQCSYIHPDDRDKVCQIMLEAKKSKEIMMGEARIIRRDGAIRTLNMTFSFEEGRTNEDGVPSFYSVMVDVSEGKAQQEFQHKALEEAFNAARQANTAKANFLSSMSHDIRTPMNAIMGMTTIASANVNDPVKVQDCLDKINVSSRHLLSLINEVLDMSKIESGRMDLQEVGFDMPDLIRNVMDICRPLLAEKNQVIEVNAARITHEKILGDMDRLQQVFMNFLSNAIKYTPVGGRIQFSITERPFSTPNMGIYEFVFADNGIGMTKEYIKHIFEPFSRADDTRVSQIQGTGLGLTISENVIRLMNGTIDVESEVGVGSCFTVSIPLKFQDENEKILKELSGLPVLVVDDNQDICESTCLLLNEMGMKGHWVTNGSEAVDQVVQAHERANDYFAVILDWKMPGMDGLETTKAIRKKVGFDVPIIILSAYDCSDIGQECFNAGANGCLSKPFFKSGMLNVFSRYLNGHTEEKKDGDVLEDNIDLTGVRILLVEDNVMNREIAEELLKMKGAMIDSAHNGKEALDMFTHSQDKAYDLILMDIQMPVMNGYEASATIRDLDRDDAKNVIIIALTANAFSEDVIMARKAGMNDHISKPIDINKLYQIINKWMVKSRVDARQDMLLD